jgi:hypothetical protein
MDRWRSKRIMKSIGRRQSTMSEVEHEEVEVEDARSKIKESTRVVVDAGRCIGE